ncbi:MAG: arginine--tRNA ligase [Bdellovibrionales bacterium]|nr:arginine--tRNA ligase [Bdellovibrionales bacterium]
MPFQDLRAGLAREIGSFLGEDAAAIEASFGAPPKPEMGHIALPCFTFAKKAGKASNKLAEEICAHLGAKGLRCQVAGPYANISFDLTELYETTLKQVFDKGAQYGADTSGSDQKILVEYCSPNIAKKLAFHHIRSTLIGNVLSNVHKFLGYDTERINFVGDWGTQFCRLMAAFEMWGDKSKLNEKALSASMDHLLEVYVRFHKELEGKPDLLDRVAQIQKRLERGDQGALSLWETIRRISLLAMEQTLKRMHVHFDHVEGESAYLKGIETHLESIKQKAGAEKSEGAWIVQVPEVSTPALIQKSDGTTLYLTRDLVAAMDRFQRFQFDKSYYIVSSQQKLHFQQLFGVLKKMGFEWADKCEHLSFGTVRFGTEKMSTREGNIVILDDLLNQAKELALKECTQKNPTLANKEEVAEMVGIGAIIFGELSSHIQRDIDFNWKHILAFDGETGPYVQYSLVRCYSLFRKATEKGEPAAAFAPLGELKLGAEEEVLLLTLARFRSVLHQVVREKEPFYLSRYLIDLAKTFNRFYYQLPILQATDPQLRAMRLNLVKATQTVLENGFSLLGIQCPKEM